MATAKYNSKAKISFVHTLRGRTKWKLDNFGMESIANPFWNTKRYVSLLEVRKVFNAGAILFEGIEKFGSCITVGKWSANVEDGRLRLGCMHFSKAATKQLQKWATR